MEDTVVNSEKRPKMARLFWQLTYYVGPDLIFLSLFASLLIGLTFFYGGRFIFLRTSFIVPLVVFSILVGVAFVTSFRTAAFADPLARKKFFEKVFAMVRDWFPLVLIVFVYENLHEFTFLIRPDTLDAQLQAIDKAIFGFEPILAMQALVTPWFTEYMTFSYALYFVFPAIVLGTVYSRDELIKFREFALGISLCLYIGFLFYILVPAIGPRYFISQQFTVPIKGIWITAKFAATWNALETVQRDCFPSLHTALSTISLIYIFRYRKVWKYGRQLFYVATPLIVSLWFSTMYLRYHWFIDVVAGWVLAYSVSRLAPWFIRWYYSRKLGRPIGVSLTAAADAAALSPAHQEEGRQ